MRGPFFTRYQTGLLEKGLNLSEYKGDCKGSIKSRITKPKSPTFVVDVQQQLTDVFFLEYRP